MEPGWSNEKQEQKWIKSIALCKKYVNTRRQAVTHTHGYSQPLPSSSQANPLFKCTQCPPLFHIFPASPQWVTPHIHLLNSCLLKTHQANSFPSASFSLPSDCYSMGSLPSTLKENLCLQPYLHLYPRSWLRLFQTIPTFLASICYLHAN